MQTGNLAVAQDEFDCVDVKDFVKSAEASMSVNNVN